MSTTRKALENKMRLCWHVIDVPGGLVVEPNSADMAMRASYYFLPSAAFRLLCKSSSHCFLAVLHCRPSSHGRLAPCQANHQSVSHQSSISSPVPWYWQLLAAPELTFIFYGMSTSSSSSLQIARHDNSLDDARAAHLRIWSATPGL